MFVSFTLHYLIATLINYSPCLQVLPRELLGYPTHVVVHTKVEPVLVNSKAQQHRPTLTAAYVCYLYGLPKGALCL